MDWEGFDDLDSYVDQADFSDIEIDIGPSHFFDTFSGIPPTLIEAAEHYWPGTVKELLNPWHGDKLLHLGFVYALSRAVEIGLKTINTLSQAFGYSDSSQHPQQSHIENPYVIAAASLTATTLFSYIKETNDPFIDYQDIAANYSAWAFHTYSLLRYGDGAGWIDELENHYHRIKDTLSGDELEFQLVEEDTANEPVQFTVVDQYLQGEE